MLAIFFFSSRRRHTRWTGDWSSDVCSSDLTRATRAMTYLWTGEVASDGRGFRVIGTGAPGAFIIPESIATNYPAILTVHLRSEERRVGKECRSRRSRYHLKKKE